MTFDFNISFVGCLKDMVYLREYEFLKWDLGFAWLHDWGQVIKSVQDGLALSLSLSFLEDDSV